jgi:hypothetical protein
VPWRRKYRVPIGASICTSLASRSPERERVVAASIENHDADAVARTFHLVEQGADLHRSVGHLILAHQLGSDRNQIVTPLDLHTVTGVVKNTYPAASTQFVAKLADRDAHLLERRIFEQTDLKTQLSERFFHRSGIVDRINQRAGGVIAVADEQCCTRLARYGVTRRGRRLGNSRKGKKAKYQQ